MNRPDLYRRALTRWGAEEQLRMVQEEANELAVAVSHYLRQRIDAKAVAEEIADVMIMCEQAMFVLHVGGDVATAMDRKLERLDARLRGEE